MIDSKTQISKSQLRRPSPDFRLAIIAIFVVAVIGVYAAFRIAPSVTETIGAPQPKLSSAIIHGKRTENIGWLEVIEIVDGDTVRVVTDDRKQIKVRLDSIDAPETDQPHAEQAKQALNRLVFGRKVDVLKTGEDRYGHTLAFLFYPNTDVNKEMILDGHAWHYREYSDDPMLTAAEVEARHRKRGLWATENPVPPWEWRKR